MTKKPPRQLTSVRQGRGESMQPIIVFLRMRAQELMQIAKSSTNKDVVERLEAMSQEMMDMAKYLEASN